MRLTVERLNLRGEGMAGGVTVPLALPGEEVEGELAEGRMATPRIVAPVPARVRPPCPHFKRCGGCALQHASDGFVAEWKRRVVERALAGQGLEAEVRLIHVSPPATRRRAVLAGRRLKKGVLVGFHARASDTIVDIPDCRLLHPGLMATLPALEEITGLGASRKAPLALTVSQSAAGADVAVTGGHTFDGPLFAKLAVLAARHDLARLAWDGEVVVERRPPAQRFGAAQVVPPPGAFLQATEDGEAALRDEVAATLDGAGRIVDLFAGLGTFALPLAAKAEVHAVEGDGAMLAALNRGWRQAPGLKRLTTETRDLFRSPLHADELARFDAAAIDPPRAGAAAQIRQIAASGLPRVAAVSCNPVSFARDARVLVDAGFRMGPVAVVDQFRWSAHVELATVFLR